MSAIRETIESLEVTRELFPRCFYCGSLISHSLLRDLVKVDGRDRLAHRECPKLGKAC